MCWLEEQGGLALTNPGDDFSVLPYRSCLDTHAHFIMEREICLGKPWAAEAMKESLRPSSRPDPVHEGERQEMLEEEVDEAMDEFQHGHPWEEHDSDEEEAQEKKRERERDEEISLREPPVWLEDVRTPGGSISLQP